MGVQAGQRETHLRERRLVAFRERHLPLRTTHHLQLGALGARRQGVCPLLQGSCDLRGGGELLLQQRVGDDLR